MRRKSVSGSRGAQDMPFIPGAVWWVDVTSTDPAVSRDFYAGLFGWSYQVDPDSRRARYTTALRKGQPVAGLAGVRLPAGRPAAWTVYLASDDIERTAQAWMRWGGRVLDGPLDVPGRGRVLTGADPTGAVIGFWQPVGRWMVHTTGAGALAWAELNTWDGARADAFFARVFGYRQRQIGDGRSVDYTIWSRGGHTILGRLQMNRDWASPDIGAHWLPHFAVDPRTGTDAAVERVLELGGWVDFEPYDSELGRIARVADPTGAAFALMDSTRRLEPGTSTPVGAARVDDPYDD